LFGCFKRGAAGAIKQESNKGIDNISENVNHVNLVNPKLMAIENFQTLSLDQKDKKRKYGSNNSGLTWLTRMTYPDLSILKIKEKKRNF
jgi:hypothetical protein